MEAVFCGRSGRKKHGCREVVGAISIAPHGQEGGCANKKVVRSNLCRHRRGGCSPSSKHFLGCFATIFDVAATVLGPEGPWRACSVQLSFAELSYAVRPCLTNMSIS